jgi:hypothetical protein
VINLLKVAVYVQRNQVYILFLGNVYFLIEQPVCLVIIVF